MPQWRKRTAWQRAAVLKQTAVLMRERCDAIARTLTVKPPNVTKYLNTLLERRFIYPHHREGRQIFYCASEDVRIIRDLPENAESLFG